MILLCTLLIPLALYATRTVLLFGPNESGRSELAQSLLGGVAVDPYEPYPLNEHIRLVDTESYEGKNMALKFVQADIRADNVDLVLLVEDCVNESSRIMTSQQALLKALPGLPLSKILGVVTLVDEDMFDSAPGRANFFVTKRKIKAMEVGANVSELRDYLLNTLGVAAKPLEVPFATVPFADLAHLIKEWKSEKVKCDSIRVQNGAFVFNGQAQDFTKFTLDNDTILLDLSRELAIRIFSGKVCARQRTASDLKIVSDLPLQLVGSYGAVNADCPSVEIDGTTQLGSLRTSSLSILGNAIVNIESLESAECLVNGKLHLVSGAVTERLVNRGELRMQTTDFRTPHLENHGTLNGASMNSGRIINYGNAIFTDGIVADLLENRGNAIMAASLITTNAEVALPEVPNLHLLKPEKIYLAFGSAGSGKDRVPRIFEPSAVTIPEERRLGDYAIVHRFADTNVAIIDVLSYDAVEWSNEKSPRTTRNGISQVLREFGLNSIAGVILFESLLHDYTCARRTIHQAQSVLRELFSAALADASTLMVYTDVNEPASRLASDAKTLLQQQGLTKTCIFGSALQSIQALTAFNVQPTKEFSDVYEVPLARTVAHIPNQGPASLLNEGFIKADRINSPSLLNRGVFIAQESKVRDSLNFGLLDSKKTSLSGKNFGTLIATSSILGKTLNAGMLCSATMSGGDIENFGTCFALRTESPIAKAVNQGSMIFSKAASVTVLENYKALRAGDITADSMENHGSARAEKVKVEGLLSNQDTIETRDFESFSQSTTESPNFKSKGCSLRGKIAFESASIDGDISIFCPAVIKELKCTGAVNFFDPNARIGSLECDHSLGCPLVRSVVFNTDGQEIQLPESAAPLKVQIKGRHSTLIITGNMLIDQLKTSHDTKVICRGTTVLDLLEDVYFANLQVEGTLTVKKGKTVYTGSLDAKPGSLIVVGNDGDLVVSSQLDLADSSQCSIAGEVRCRDFLVDDSRTDIPGNVIASRNFEVFGDDVSITGGIYGKEQWKIEANRCVLRSLPAGLGFIKADALTIQTSPHNTFASLIIGQSYSGATDLHVQYFQYDGHAPLSLADARIEVLIAPNMSGLSLSGRGSVAEMQVAKARITVDGIFQTRLIEAAGLDLQETLTVSGAGNLLVHGSFDLKGKLFIPEGHVRADSMSSAGLCMAKAIQAKTLGDFSPDSYTSVHGLQSSETVNWGPHGVLDVGYLELQAAQNFAPKFLYAAIVQAPNCRFAPQAAGLVSVMPDARHEQSFVHCREYVLPTIEQNSAVISDRVYRRVFGHWPEQSPVSIRQTKFESATSIRFRDTFVQASSTHFPSDLGWDGRLQVRTGSDLNIERFCSWDGGSLALKAPNMTVRGLLNLSGDMFLDIANHLLIERCQDRWTETVVETSTKRTCGISHGTNKHRRTMHMARTDPRSGIVMVGGQAQIKAHILEEKAGQIISGGDLAAKADVFKASCNIDTGYEKDVAKGGSFWGSQREAYARQTGEIHAPMLVSGGEKVVEFGEMDVTGCQMVSKDDISGHIKGNATMRTAYVWEEGKKKISRSGFGVTKCTQERYTKLAPSTYGSTDGNTNLKVDKKLSSEGTMWIGKDNINIEAQSADFSAAYAESYRKTDWSGMADPLSYTAGSMRERMRQAMPNTFSANNVNIHMEDELAAEAPIFDADRVKLKSDKENVKIRAAVNEYEMESESISVSVNFFGSDALRAAANGEKGWGAKFLDEVPLLGALKGMATAKGNQQLACASVNTALAAVGTLRELSMCGGLKDYMINRLARVELSVTMTEEEQRVMEQVGMVMARPGASLSVEAKKDVSIAGLSGQLDSLFAKGANVTFDPLKTESCFSSDTTSIGASYNFATQTPGVSFGAGHSEGHSVSYQSPGLIVNKMSLHADEKVEIGTFIKTMSTFIETKKLVIESHKGTSTSSNWNFSVSVGLPGESNEGKAPGAGVAAGDGNKRGPLPSVGGSFGFGSSRNDNINLAGIEADTMHIKAPDGIELKGAVLRLTESAKATPSDDGNEWFEFALPTSLEELSSALTEEEAMEALRGWSEAAGKSVQIWTSAGGRYVRGALSNPGHPVVNLLMKENGDFVSFSMLDQKPGIIETSYIRSTDVETIQKESYFGLGISDIMACASCAGYVSLDIKQYAQRTLNHAMMAQKMQTGGARFEGDFLARTEAERVWTEVERNIDISLKGIPIITDFEEYFAFMKPADKIDKEVEDLIWEALEQALDDEYLDDLPEANESEPFDPDGYDDEYIDMMFKESLEAATRDLEASAQEAEDEKKEKNKTAEKKADKESPKATTELAEKDAEANHVNASEDQAANTAAQEENPDVEIGRRGRQTEPLGGEFVFDYEQPIDSEGPGSNRTIFDIDQDAYQFETPKTAEEMSIYKKTVLATLWLAEGSEPALEFLGQVKCNYSMIRLLMKATPAKIFVDLVGKQISRKFLREATKETVVRVISETIFLSIADPTRPLTEQRELSARVHKASCIMYDWYALIMTSKGLGEDLKAFGKDLKRFGKASWKAIKKSGAMNWLRAKFSKDELMKKSEQVIVTMLKRTEKDLNLFMNHRTRFINKYKKLFYEKTIGYTPMAESIWKGTKQVYKHRDKIGQAIDHLGQ